jgi:hypothetical protein
MISAGIGEINCVGRSGGRTVGRLVAGYCQSKIANFSFGLVDSGSRSAGWICACEAVVPVTAEMLVLEGLGQAENQTQSRAR